MDLAKIALLDAQAKQAIDTFINRQGGKLEDYFYLPLRGKMCIRDRAYPDQVAAVAVGAAGWYTFPDLAARFPRGLKTRSKWLKSHLKPEAFLKVPMAAFVGERDVRRGSERPELKQSVKVDAQQGLTRLERGRHWIEAMRAAAAAHGLTTAYQYEVLPHASHSFKASMKHGHLGQRVFDFLFGSPPVRRSS